MGKVIKISESKETAAEAGLREIHARIMQRAMDNYKKRQLLKVKEQIKKIS